MPDQLIGYVLSFVLLGGIGWGLPRWFGWRKSLRRMLTDARDLGDV